MSSNEKKIHLGIFASGTGSNARKIADYFNNHPFVTLALIVSNKPDAPVLEMARGKNIPTVVIHRKDFYQTSTLLETLKNQEIDLIVLAGFLWLVPEYLIKAYPNRIINIHPSLLPRHGGKGMYGMHVHEAVKKAGETESGITIHYVNQEYDQGAIIFQKTVGLEPEDTPQSIAKKVQNLEHTYFSEQIEKIARRLI